MRGQVHIAEDAAAAALACGEALAAEIAKAIKSHGRAMVGVSGGSTPKLMFAEMAKMPIEWARVHLFFVDERVVPPDHELSNYRMTKQYLIDPASIPAANVHRVKGELPAADAAEEYNAEIARVFEIRPGETPVFDALQCGIGSDAHTASLFPGEPLVEARGGVAAAVYAEKMGQWRVTLLPAVLQGARKRLVLASGADKSGALRRVLKAPWDESQLPAQLLVEQGLTTDLFVDRDAAAEVY